MAFEAGLNRSWYKKGKKSGASGKHSDMYAAWSAAKGKPKTPGKRVTAQESFFQGWFDGTQRNPGVRKSRLMRTRKRATTRRNPRVRTRVVRKNSTTLKGYKSVTVKKLPDGRVQVTGRK